MKDRIRRVAVTVALGGALVTAGGLGGAEARRAPGKPPRDYPVQPVPFTAVHFDDAFWLPRIEVNRYNKVLFRPVNTSGLRLEVVLPREWSAGIQEWKAR